MRSEEPMCAPPRLSEVLRCSRIILACFFIDLYIQVYGVSLYFVRALFSFSFYLFFHFNGVLVWKLKHFESFYFYFFICRLKILYYIAIIINSMQIIIALRFYATHTFQRVIGDSFGVIL